MCHSRESRKLHLGGVRTGLYVVFAFALVVAPAGCAAFADDEPAVPEAALSTLVLQPEDLPAFTRFDEGALAIADAPTGERADPERFGRVGGWKARYRRPGSARTRGPLVVESRADLFASSGGAGKELDAHRDELHALRSAGAEVIALERLGDEAVALTPGAGDAPGSVVLCTIVWRSRNVSASLTTNGFSGKLRLADVVELARAQQRRIDAAAPRGP